MSALPFRHEPFQVSQWWDAEALCDDAKRNGYIFISQLIDPGVVLEMRRRVLEQCQQLGWLTHDGDLILGQLPPVSQADVTGDAFVELQRRVFSQAEIIEFGRHANLIRVFETIFGSPVKPDCGHVCRVVFPFAWELTTPPHQDGNYLRESTELWTAWIPLGDCPIELGSLAVWPGSHRFGLLPHDDNPTNGLPKGSSQQENSWSRKEGSPKCISVPNEVVWAASDFRCGDVLLFHCLTVHRACPNVSSGLLRISVDYRFQPK